MRKLFTVLILLSIVSTGFAVELTNFFGTISARERYDNEEYLYSDPRTANFGEPYQKITNDKVRVGYRLGIKLKFHDNLTAGLTLRSGIRSVMWQDINNIAGLTPGVQEAYINWRLFEETAEIAGREKKFYTTMEFGIIPQAGNAMWDLYAAHQQTDNPGRADDPRDGTFADRMSGLNGARITVGIGCLSLRGVYHTDKVEGRRVEWMNSSSPNDNVPDKYTVLAGGELNAAEALQLDDHVKGMNLTLGYDYGWAYRVGNWYKSSKDSVYFDESIWGMYANIGPQWANLNFGYGSNERDSIHLSRYWDYKLVLGFPEGMVPDMLADLQLVGNYQIHSQIHKFGQYNGHNAEREAIAIYINKKILNLDWQPRAIFFTTSVSDKKIYTNTRYEITTTVTFDMTPKQGTD